MTHDRKSNRQRRRIGTLAPAKAKAESRSLDFKSRLDPDNAGDWCELVKDFVAIANSGGGTILIGVADDGEVVSGPATLRILHTDPAIVTDKIAKYTAVQFDAFAITAAKRKGRKIAIITIGSADLPIVFEKPGTYELANGKQKTAFSAGTLYVRHGAKSEPARSADIARLIQGHVQRARKEWLSGVRKVTAAPIGSTISFLPSGVIQSSDPVAAPIRITKDPGAPGYQIIDPDKTHPWRQKELLEQLNKSLPTKINSFDLLAARRLHQSDDDPNFVYKPHFGSAQYSPLFAEWLLNQHSRDPTFFQKCRSAFKPVGSVHRTDDETLRWAANFMDKHGLGISKMARRLRISDATFSRLLSGKYTGNVSRMLQRIESYRREVATSDEEAAVSL